MQTGGRPPGPGSRRIRVLTLVDQPSLYGGAEHLAVMIATHLDSERFESRLCLSRWPPTASWPMDASAESALALVDAAGIPLVPLHRRHKVELGAWKRLASYLRRNQVDVLHTHKFGSNVWGTLAGRTARVPVILAHEHSWSYQGQPLRQALDRHLIAKGATRLIAVSTEDRRRMTEVERIPPERTVYVPNGITLAPPTPGRQMRNELGIAPETPVIGTVAVLRPVKALAVLLEAAAELVGEWPSLRIVIAGDGPEAEMLKRRSQELGLTANACFLGSRTDVPDVLSMLDVAVCCSDSEGSPLSVMEYMAAGCSIVATAVGGIPDLITPEVHGLLVPRRDPKALAAALRRVLRDRTLARSLAENARARQSAEFDLSALVGRLETLYTELSVEQPSNRRPAEASYR